MRNVSHVIRCSRGAEQRQRYPMTCLTGEWVRRDAEFLRVRFPPTFPRQCSHRALRFSFFSSARLILFSDRISRITDDNMILQRGFLFPTEFFIYLYSHNHTLSFFILRWTYRTIHTGSKTLRGIINFLAQRIKILN